MPQQPETPKPKPRRPADWASLPPSGGPLHAVDGVLGVTRIRPVSLVRTGNISERPEPARDTPLRSATPRTPERANHDAEHLNQVARVLDLAQEVLGSEDAALAWLRAPNVRLAGETPHSVMVSPTGLAQVLRLLKLSAAP